MVQVQGAMTHSLLHHTWVTAQPVYSAVSIGQEEKNDMQLCTNSGGNMLMLVLVLGAFVFIVINAGHTWLQNRSKKRSIRSVA